jgi:hypothetical protein
MLFPNARVRMRLIDKLLIGVPAVPTSWWSSRWTGSARLLVRRVVFVPGAGSSVRRGTIVGRRAGERTARVNYSIAPPRSA